MLSSQLANMSDFDIHNMSLELIHQNKAMADKLGKFTLMEDDMFVSPKLTKLRELLPALVNDGHRILLFSQWTSCLDILECLMNALDMKFFRLDGQATIAERQDMIDEFNSDLNIPVFLLR